MDITVLIYIIAIIIGTIINVAIGGWIGSTKGRTGMGQLLGFLAGPLGWLIIALLPTIQQTSAIPARTSIHASRGKPCPMCGLLISQGNTKCPSCDTPVFTPNRYA